MNGTVPESLGALTTLLDIDLRDNAFTGLIPEAFGQLSQLDAIYIQNNELTGNVDPIFCDNKEHTIKKVEADCREPNPRLVCSCCTLCCKADGTRCASPTPAPATAPTLLPAAGQARFDDLVDILEPVSGTESFANPASPQYKAAWWLAAEDAQNLDFGLNPFDNIAQRYVLAVMFHALNGENWSGRQLYMGNQPTCLWEGASCNDAGSIIRLDLRGNKLLGSIPAEVGLLKNLLELMLGRQSIRFCLNPHLTFDDSYNTFNSVL